ncbi:hypothetical protein, partial [Limnohabitans sp.]|uniref:hypothetical protein n=1 Tax=Limnohabitans sp. TaxID=1907725 RepID=UPI0025C2D437
SGSTQGLLVSWVNDARRGLRQAHRVWTFAEFPLKNTANPPNAVACWSGGTKKWARWPSNTS